ncbi:MAG: hypothetical protein ACRED8_03380, partial [Caulobacteraceae bacterium]
LIPWTGSGWGARCRLGLRFQKKFTLTAQFCKDRELCRAGASIADEVARRYDRSGAHNLQIGGLASPEAWADVKRATAETLASPVPTPDFPTFGSLSPGMAPTYSSGDFGFFPVVMGAQSYVGAIGRNGVGWRESNQILFSIFSEDKLTPLAGFVIVLSNGGLAETIVEDPRPGKEIPAFRPHPSP